MTDTIRRVHFAELARYIGWSLLEASPHRSDFGARISAVKHANLHMIVGLDSVEKTLAVDENVRLWRPSDKIDHLSNPHRRNGAIGNMATVVPAGQLKEHIGSLAFLESGSPGVGPHIVIDCAVVGGHVQLTMSSSEVVGKYDMMVEIAKPEPAQARGIPA